MKNFFTILMLFSALTGFSQITTQTLNTTTSVSATNQTITTYTVLTTNTVLNNANMFDFSFDWNLFTSYTNTTTGVLKVSMNNGSYDSFTLSKNLITNTFDSLRITLSVASTDPINTIGVNGTSLVTTITTNTPQYQTHSVKVVNTNITAPSYSLILNGGINLWSSIFLKDLTVKSYSTSVKSDTVNAVITGIKSFEILILNLFVSGNTIKSSVNNEDLKLKVLDITGKQVFETILTKAVQTDLSEGIYILNVFDSQNNLIVKKRVFIAQ